MFFFGHAPVPPDGPDDEDETGRVEASCKNKASDMNMDLSGKPPEREESKKGACGELREELLREQ